MADNLKKLQKLIDTNDVDSKIEKDPKLRSLRRVEDVLKLVTESLTRDEFVKNFKTVIDFVKKATENLRVEHEQSIADIKGEFKNINGNTAQEFDRLEKKLKKETDVVFGEIDNLMNFVRDKVRDIKDGKDADEEKIVENVLAQIPEKEEFKHPSREEHRDELESLEGDERLDKSAIKGLDEEFERIEGIAVKHTAFVGGSGGGQGGGIVKAYDLSDQLDGSTKTFTMPVFWRIISVHSSSFPRAFRETTDYTADASVPNITFTSEIPADSTLATGQTLIVVYAEP